MSCHFILHTLTLDFIHTVPIQWLIAHFQTLLNLHPFVSYSDFIPFKDYEYTWAACTLKGHAPWGMHPQGACSQRCFTLQLQTFGEQQQHEHKLKSLLSIVSVIAGCSLHKKQTKKFWIDPQSEQKVYFAILIDNNINRLIKVRLLLTSNKSIFPYKVKYSVLFSEETCLLTDLKCSDVFLSFQITIDEDICQKLS